MFASRYRFIYVFLLTGYSYLNIKFTEGDQLIPTSFPEVILFFVLALLIFLIWEGNRFIQIFLDGKSFKKSIYYPLIVGFVASVFWITLISLSAIGTQYFVGIPFTMLTLKLALGFTFRINLFLNCIHVIVTYRGRLVESQVAVETAKREVVNARYDALKRQINPHFLFNSLNVLDGLIKINTDDASLFLQRLSDVYRYLTLQEDRDLIRLAEEIKFIQSYTYLLEVRFKNNLDVKIEIREEDLSSKIVPSALQMVLENAIKHNEISRNNSLHIQIISENGYLLVRNSIRLKSTSAEPSGIGLENIRLRYEFLGIVLPEISNDGKYFSVKLPLIKLGNK